MLSAFQIEKRHNKTTAVNNFLSPPNSLKVTQKHIAAAISTPKNCSVITAIFLKKLPNLRLYETVYQLISDFLWYARQK